MIPHLGRFFESSTVHRIGRPATPGLGGDRHCAQKRRMTWASVLLLANLREVRASVEVCPRQATIILDFRRQVSYMQVAIIESYKQKLIDLESRLSGDVNRLIAAIPDEVTSPGTLSNVPTHNADNDSEMFETDIELVRNEQGLQSQVHDALARIEAGTYGICQRCDKEIPKARLDAMPYATYCKECTELVDAETD